MESPTRSRRDAAACSGAAGWCAGGHASLAEVTAVTLYAVQIVDPVDRLISWLDEVQVGATALARILGVELVPDDRTATDEEPADEHLRVEDVRFAYREDRDVLHGIDLDVRPGERLAVVGPSGAGQVDAGPAAGRRPPAADRHGSRVGDVPLVDLPLDDLRGPRRRWSPRSTTSSSARVRREPRCSPDRTPTRATCGTRSPRSTRSTGSLALPDGLATEVGSGGRPVTPAQAQQLALARLVLADPHTLVLDEATSLLDPRAARHLERSLGGRAARPHRGRDRAPAAHRARRRPGRGGRGRAGHRARRHHELVAAGGAYAALWESWSTDPSTAAAAP